LIRSEGCHIAKNAYHTHARLSSLRPTITANGHHLTADEHESAGGTKTGPTPMELLLAALGSRSSIACGCTPIARAGSSG